MNNLEFEKWLETIRRRQLSPAEQSQLDDLLSRNPDQRETWAREEALTRLLLDLPDPPLSPRFTERVLAATRLPTTASPLSRWRLGWPRLPRPALGFACAGLVLLLVGASLLLQQQRAHSRFASSVADLSRQIELAASATDLPAVQLLQDFDPIYRLSQSDSLVDEELLAALQ